MIFSILKRNEFYIEKGCHSENVIIIVLEGSFSLHIDDKSYLADKNSVIYFEKDIYFERHVISPVKLVYIQFIDKPNLKTGMLQFKDTFRRNSTIHFLEQAINTKNENLCRYFTDDLYIQIYAEQQLSKTLYSKEVAAFIEYVKDNYKNKISIKQFSDYIFMSHTGFLLKFKKETGITPIEYINTYRLTLASDLLLNSNTEIGRIADLCGYENLYYFSNAFKKHFNVSPTQYRKNNV